MRRAGVRWVVGGLGGLLALGAVALAALCRFPVAAAIGFWALILLGGLAIERWRYKPFAAVPPGPDWQRTEERFLDPETGKLVTVYFHPRTGERRYIAA